MFNAPFSEADFALASYKFDLPDAQIAQTPSAKRGADSLYVLERSASDASSDSIEPFATLAALLPPRSLLVANNSMVAPARLISTRPSGGLMEVLLLTPPPIIEAEAQKSGPEKGGESCALAEALLRPAKKIKSGERYELAPCLAMQVLEKQDFGQAKIMLMWQGSLQARIAAAGQLPLPPYIKRKPSAEDSERYQTIYADPAKAGSLAAPTAGLHFTPQIKKSLLDAGHDWLELTLFVGYGTFSPVRVADIRQHQMHPEYVELSQDAVRQILAAKAEGRPIIAVGTTSARSLEGVAAELAAEGHAELLAPKEGWLNCFIHPGKPIRVIDGMVTNFHLPESTLLMLVSALTGRERILAAYRRAVEEKLRFFSYGDAMLIK